MHIKISRDSLFFAFFHSQSVVEKRGTVPILSHAMISTNENGIEIMSTDMDLSVVEEVFCEVLKDGKLCVPSVLMHDILKKIKSGMPVEIYLNEDSSFIILSSGRSKFEIPFINAEEFPNIINPEETFECSFSIPAPTLKYLINSVKFSMSNDEMRYFLNGIYFEIDQEKKEIKAIATDRHRLAVVQIEAPDDALNMPSIIVGKKTIQEMLKLLEEASEPVFLKISETRIELRVKTSNGSASLGSRLIDGHFPDCNPILSIKHDKKFITGTKQFSEVVDRVGTVILQKIKMVKLTLERNLLKCSTIETNSIQGNEDIDVDFNNDSKITLCFDLRFLMDVTSNIEAEEFEFNILNEETAILIKPINIPNVSFILMPLSL